MCSMKEICLPHAFTIRVAHGLACKGLCCHEACTPYTSASISILADAAVPSGVRTALQGLFNCRSAVAQALPQLQHLDRLPLDNERECLSQQRGPAAQHIAELQLQAYQPLTEAHLSQRQLAAEPLSEAADRGGEQHYPWQVAAPYLQGMAALPQDVTYLQCMQQLPNIPRAPGLTEALANDEVQNLADRLAQRLAQSRAALPEEAAGDSAKQEQRWASMEARLSALLEAKLALPNQADVTRATELRNGSTPETAAQLADIRRGSMSQKQQHVRQDSSCQGSQKASSAVQRLQVCFQWICAAHVLPASMSGP